MTRRSHFVLPFFALSLLVAGLTRAAPARAGTPLMCHTNDIGTAASLPWGDASRSHHAPLPDYPANRLVKDTLALLNSRTAVLVRMETLRRATIYARELEGRGHPRLADELLNHLQTRALDAEAAGKPDPLAWFDAGYLAASVAESFPDRQSDHGYRWVVRALRARGGDPEMEFAAALIAREPSSTPDGHWARARAAGQRDPLLARNIAARTPRPAP